MGLVLLTKDRILADYLRLDCPLLTENADCPSALKKGDLCVLDADSFPPPYPACTCLLISRKKQETQLPLLLRPLAPAALTEALQASKEPLPRLLKEQRAILTEKGSLTFPILEFALLEYLFEHKGETVSREELCLCLVNLKEGASQTEHADALLTVYIYRLRKKLSPLGLSLVSQNRKGYMLALVKT